MVKKRKKKKASNPIAKELRKLGHKVMSNKKKDSQELEYEFYGYEDSEET